MKKTITKKLHNLFIAIIFFATLEALAVTSCKIPSADSISAIPAGTINVSFGSASSASARSAVPDLATAVAVYILTCKNTDTGSSATAEVSGTTSYQFADVVAGNIIVSVEAYSSATTKDTTTLIAKGSSSFTLDEGKGVNVPIQLEMAATGASGKIELAIQWPSSLADTVTWKLDGNAPTMPTIDTGTTTKSAILAANASAGSHVMAITFTNGGVTVGTAIETVNVYANLTSNKWIDASGKLANYRAFSANDFSVMGTGIGLLITSGTSSYIANLSTANTATTINVPNSASSIVFIPTETEIGQTIQYAWGAGGYATTASGQPVSLSYAGTATTLSFKVTNTASSATQSYTVTVNPATPISDTTGLATMSSTGNYVLTADINMSSYGNWTPTGSIGTPFKGTFDGGGHTISNLAVTSSAGDSGLFGYINAPAVISNVRLKNVAINCTGGDVNNDGVGGIVGENWGGTVTRCSVSGIISGKGYRVGGVVGHNRTGGTVSECYSTATVMTTGEFAGGLVGWNWGTIENCYSRGSVSANTAVGGLVDMNLSGTPTPTVTNCYSASSVSYTQSGSNIGGFMARNYGTFSDDYYDSTVSGCGVSGEGTAKTTSDMKTQSTYTGWEFDTIWAIDPKKNGGYPYLRALPIPDDIVIPAGTSAAALNALLSNNLDGNFVVTGPLDLSGVSNWTPIGSHNAPFTGTFNGNDNTLSGLKITATASNPDGCGFFGNTTSSALIENVHLVNATVQSATGTTAGVIAGYNNGVISRCSSTGSLSNPSGGFNGGLVGNNAGTIEESYSSTTVTVTGGYYNGGLVGISTGRIINCYARGGVTGYSCCGGLVGYNGTGGVITNSYATGIAIAVDAAQGGLAGGLNASTFTATYYDSTITPTSNGLGTGISTSNMKTQSNYSGWNFTNIWATNGSINDGYPYLLNNKPQ